MESLKIALTQFFQLPEEEWSNMESIVSIQSFKENDFLLKQEEICNSIYFVQSGTLKLYHQDDNLECVNLLLSGPMEFITDYESFLSQQKSKYAIQAISDCTVISLKKEDLENLYAKSFYWNVFGRKVSEQLYILSKIRTEELLFKNPEQRYVALLEKQPEFFKKYPLKEIAAYLGIKPQSLSRIRARINKEVNLS